MYVSFEQQHRCYLIIYTIENHACSCRRVDACSCGACESWVLIGRPVTCAEQDAGVGRAGRARDDRQADVQRARRGRWRPQGGHLKVATRPRSLAGNADTDDTRPAQGDAPSC